MTLRVLVAAVLCCLAAPASAAAAGPGAVDELVELASPFSAKLVVGGEASTADRRQAAAAYSRLPLTFERNQGQFHRRLRYVSRGAGYALGLTRRGWMMSAGEKGGVLRGSFLGASRAVRLEARGSSGGRVNYLTGADRGDWERNVPTRARVLYRGVWEGIDVLFYGKRREFEYDYRLAPGADPRQIALRFAGQRGLRLDREGNLVVAMPGGAVRLLAPIAYQGKGEDRREVASRYAISGDTVRVRLDAYDRTRPLVIDPVISHSTFIGGTGVDAAGTVALDGDGNAYVVGTANSLDFPTSDGAVQEDPTAGGEGFVAKLENGGNSVAYATYLGGSGGDETGGIAVDDDGAAYVTGSTSSADFPVTEDVAQPENATENQNFSTRDAYVAKLTPEGDDLEYSTYYGGSEDDRAYGIAVDGSGNVSLVGETDSEDLPDAPGAISSLYEGGSGDAFFARLNADATEFSRSAYIGGDGLDYANEVVLDSAGGAVIAGTTSSDDFPSTGGAVQIDLSGEFSNDAFVVRTEPDGSAIDWATYLGGTSSDSGAGVALDADDNVYLVGSTSSSNLNGVGGFAYQATKAPDGNYDAFAAKLNASGSAIGYATYLGGDALDFGFAIDVDEEGLAYVGGVSQSSDYPVTDDALQETRAGTGDGFLTQLDPDASDAVYSSYLGGSGGTPPNAEGDNISGLALDDDGNAFLVGVTWSSNFPTTSGASQKTLGGNADGYLAVVTSKRSTSTSINCGTATLDVGQSVACDVSVRDTESGTRIPPTGSVSFESDKDGDFEAGSCNLTSGTGNTPSTCVITYTPTEGGDNEVTAEYEGDDEHAPSSGDTKVKVKGDDPGPGPGKPPVKGGGTGGTGGGTDDDDKPNAKLGGKSKQKLGSAVAVVVTCQSTNPCAARAAGTVSVPSGAKVYRLKRTKRKTIKPGERATIKLKLPKKLRKAAKRALRKGRKVNAKLRVTVTDGPGKGVTLKRTVRLRR